MKKFVKLLAIALLVLSVFCVSAMAVGTDDAQMTFIVRDGVNYIGSNPVPWCAYLTASDGSGKIVYSYVSGDTNLDGDTDVCDLVKINKDSLDFDFDKLFSSSDLNLMREIIFNPSHTYEIKLDTFQLQMKAEAEAAGAPFDKHGRQLVWHDEFNGNALNTRNWGFDGTTMYTADHEYVTDSDHVRVENGFLNLYVKKSTKEGKVVSMPKGLVTTNNMLFKYGYLEMRAKVPYQKGAWPSFWCTSRTPLQEAENRMEVDIMEVMGYTNKTSANLHKWSNDGSEHLAFPSGWGWPSTTYTFKNASNLKNEYHTYGFAWDPDYMTIYVDDQKVVTFEISGEKATFREWWQSKSKFEDSTMFQDWLRVIINNECFTEGSATKPSDGCIVTGSELPFEYSIDYVRLYQNRGNGEIFKTTDEIAAIVAEKNQQ